VVNRRLRRLVIGAAIAAGLYLAIPPLLAALGAFLVVDDAPEGADAVVVLASGVDVYPRIVHAARLYAERRAARVVINGDRRNAAFRDLEARGFRRPCGWDAEGRAMLGFLGVPDRDIVSFSAPDAYDTVSEADSVIPQLRARGWKRIAVTTSDFHSRRARAIWRALAPDLDPRISPAVDGQFEARGWWRDGRQIRWVLAEYGGWLAQFWRF
jgi:uncharacterized SAM-binding protein YcdF (DUF218 family)